MPLGIVAVALLGSCRARRESVSPPPPVDNADDYLTHVEGFRSSASGSGLSPTSLKFGSSGGAAKFVMLPRAGIVFQMKSYPDGYIYDDVVTNSGRQKPDPGSFYRAGWLVLREDTATSTVEVYALPNPMATERKMVVDVSWWVDDFKEITITQQGMRNSVFSRVGVNPDKNIRRVFPSDFTSVSTADYLTEEDRFLNLYSISPSLLKFGKSGGAAKFTISPRGGSISYMHSYPDGNTYEPVFEKLGARRLTYAKPEPGSYYRAGWLVLREDTATSTVEVYALPNPMATERKMVVDVCWDDTLRGITITQQGMRNSVFSCVGIDPDSIISLSPGLGY